MNLKKKIKQIPNKPGVYCFYDLEETPAYAGKTGRSIRGRIREHLIRQDSSAASYGKLDMWDIYYVKYWETENEDSAEEELIAALDPYLNIENIEKENENLDINNPTGRLNVISDEETKFRKQPYNRTKQKLKHLERMLDKIKLAEHTQDTQKLLYRHLELMENNLEDFLDVKQK